MRAREEERALLAARGNPRRNGSPCRFYMGPLRGFIAARWTPLAPRKKDSEQEREANRHRGKIEEDTRVVLYVG